MERDLTKTFQDDYPRASQSRHILANTEMGLYGAAFLTQINRRESITFGLQKSCQNFLQVAQIPLAILCAYIPCTALTLVWFPAKMWAVIIINDST